MPSDAARLEVLGETDVEVGWRSRIVRVPLDLDRWPLDLIGLGRNVAAVEMLTAGQDILSRETVLDDVRELSHVLAAAVGVERLPEQPDAPDEWFGGIPTLLELLRNHELDVASDLKAGWGVDLDDRHRPIGDERRITLRKVWTYVRRLRSTSAVARAKNGGRTVWTEDMFIMAGVWEALTGKHYPGRPLRPEELAALIEAVQAEADHVATLKERTARYAPPAEAPPASGGGPIAAAMAEAIANRQTEMGHTADG